MARAVINQCGGDLNMAMLKLLALAEGTPVDELCEFGGLDRKSAENYFQRASEDLEVAKALILQGIIHLLILQWTTLRRHLMRDDRYHYTRRGLRRHRSRRQVSVLPGVLSLCTDSVA